MAREPRIEYPGAIYHVYNRGDRGGAIYRDVADRERFLDGLEEACGKTGWIVHAYVLMTNHYHLLIETPEANLVAGMKWLQGTYTQRFNKRHHVSGSLFGGRYKSPVVDPGEGGYFESVSTYIHLNPARTGSIDPGSQKLEMYAWSSYPWYLKQGRQRPKWLCVVRTLGCFDQTDTPEGRKRYQQYMAGRLQQLTTDKGREALQAQWKAIRRGWCLGGDAFRKRLLAGRNRLRTDRRHGPSAGEPATTDDERKAERLLSAALAELNLTLPELRQRAKSDPDKQLLAWLLRKNTVAGNRWISDKLEMGHISNVSNSVRRIHESKQQEIVSLRNRVEQILNDRTDSHDDHTDSVVPDPGRAR